PSCKAAVSNGPAMTMDSLLASNRRLPARAAASVEASPAAPTMAATTVSTPPMAATVASASGPASTAQATPAPCSARASVSLHAASAMTATAGRCRTQSSTSLSTLRWAVRTVARKRAGCRATTSSALAPMEPVAPRMATDWGVGVMAPDAGEQRWRGVWAGRDPGSAPKKCHPSDKSTTSWPQHHQPRRKHRQGRKHAVQPVQQAAVAGKNATGVLDLGVALHQAFEQVADDGGGHGEQAEQAHERQFCSRHPE